MLCRSSCFISCLTHVLSLFPNAASCVTVRAKSLQLCPTLCDSMDCSPPGSSVHGILQAGTALLFNMLSRLVITFLPRNKCLLISWLQSQSAVILEPKKINSDTVSIVSPFISKEEVGQIP